MRGQLAYTTVNEDGWGAYKKAVSDAIREFNSLAKKNKLCVSFVKGGDSAEVQIEVSAGPEISYTFEGEDRTEKFSSDWMHGYTPQLTRNGRIEKAFTFLPKSPPMNTPSGVRAAESCSG